MKKEEKKEMQEEQQQTETQATEQNKEQQEKAEMTDAEFNAMMRDGLSAAKADCSSAASEVFTDLRRGLCM